MYSPDGTQITLYLDGVGVPVTQQQRALTADMAKMSHDFYEVVFLAYEGTEPKVARTTWEIGQSAGIKGVYGNNTTAGFQYVPTFITDSGIEGGFYGVTFLFVGRKVDKALLAVGRLTDVTNVDGTSSGLRITSSTKSVTFTVSSFSNEINISNRNFSVPVADAKYVSLLGAPYPYFKLPTNSNGITAQHYFTIIPFIGFNGYMRIIDDGPIKPEVIKREPRFLSGGRYYYVQQAKLDTGTDVIFGNHPELTNGGNFDFITSNGVPFIFDTSNSQGGIFSFTFRIPVYNITRINTNGVPSVTWYIQPGFGRDLWSLDNGVDAGGCILMGTEDFGDWMDIFTAGP